MARYTQDVVLNKPDDFVAFMMNDFLQKHSFTQKTWKGQPAYRRGDGFFEGYRFMTWNYNNGVLHLEAWLKGPFGGEQALTGFWGWAVKAGYKSDIDKLIELLHQTIPEPGMTAADASSPNASEPGAPITVQTVDNSQKAVLSLIMGILSICLSFFIPLFAFLAGAFGIIFNRSSVNSSKPGLAKAGKICSIVGICLALAIYVLNIVLTLMSATL